MNPATFCTCSGQRNIRINNKTKQINSHRAHIQCDSTSMRVCIAVFVALNFMPHGSFPFLQTQICNKYFINKYLFTERSLLFFMFPLRAKLYQLHLCSCAWSPSSCISYTQRQTRMNQPTQPTVAAHVAKSVGLLARAPVHTNNS